MTEDHLPRVRRICLSLPGAFEKLSHGEPTFFVKKGVFAMMSTNHHNDGHIALTLAAPPGHQAALIAANPAAYYRPPYVGVKGWIGVELGEIGDEELAAHVRDSWALISSKKPNSKKH